MPRIFDDSIGPIGSIVSSMLTETQYQTLYGPGWVLMDGRSCAGSVYASITGASTIPDARGLVLRGNNNGRADGKQNPETKALGDYQGDVFKEHLHTASSTGSGSVGIYNAGTNYDNGSAYSAMAAGGSTSVSVSVSTTINNTGDVNETRMRNITVNHFIRIN